MTKPVALITGASSGIGEALAREYAQRGFDLVLLARRLDRLGSLATELKGLGCVSIVHRCDVTVDGDLEKAATLARERFGRIDVVIANAGFGVGGWVEKLSLDDFRRQFETNVFGVLRTLYATLADLKKSKGSFVVIGSVASYVPLPTSVPYSMSKFAVRALAEGLRVELASQGVNVTLVSPGFVESEIRMTDGKGREVANVKQDVPSLFLMKAADAARDIASAERSQERERVVTRHGKAIVFLQNHVPWLVRPIVAFGIKQRKGPGKASA